MREIDSRLYKRQLDFLRTLRRKPALGGYVIELHWTAVYMPDEVDETELQSHLQPCAVEYEEGVWGFSYNKLYHQLRKEFDFNSCNSYLWETFALMDQIRLVDIAFMDEYEREADPPPPRLFSSAQSIRLTGISSRYLIKSLLGSVEPEHLRHLHLNNLIEFAEVEGVREGTTLREKGKIQPFPRTVNSAAGPMRTHLTPFIGKWTSLETLVIDTVGEPTPGCSGIASAAIEEGRYRELGTFIRSVSPTLRVLHFQQGLNGSNHGFRNGSLRCPQFTIPYPDGTRPMDLRFHRHILPAIAESAWPNLRKLELYGVASYSYRPGNESRIENVPLSVTDQGRIRRAVGDEVELDIRADAMKHFWVAEPSATGIREIEEDNYTSPDEYEDESEEEAEDDEN
ncbi:hypothetical protein PG991_013424 [Apiospora marii]|uniref:Uncharacterized protein n=1 Tax=Apiospora marii TaxID=335849 RepID=A0ABR1R6Q0_9PEZI